MGNAATRQPAQFVLVPPLFEPAGLYDRDARAYSAYRMAFGQSHRARFFSHMYTAGGASCRVALRPPGENIDIAVAATEAHGGGIAPELSLHYALPANSPFSGSFVKASNKSGSGGGLCLSGCALHARSGAGGFFRARPGASPLVGARLSNPGLGIGLGAAGQDDKGMVLAWAVARLKAGLMLGYEFSREHEETETERVALGYGKKRGGTRLDAVIELRQPRDRTRAELAMSFLYHFSVRRDVQNPIERMDVVGITNYVDIGAEMVTSIHDNELREFQVGAAWQLNKNWLLKARMERGGVSAVVALKSWSNGLSCTLAQCNHLDFATRQLRTGFWFSAENFGDLRYDRAVMGKGQVLREHLASPSEVAGSADRMLVTAQQEVDIESRAAEDSVGELKERF